MSNKTKRKIIEKVLKELAPVLLNDKFIKELSLNIAGALAENEAILDHPFYKTLEVIVDQGYSLIVTAEDEPIEYNSDAGWNVGDPLDQFPCDAIDDPIKAFKLTQEVDMGTIYVVKGLHKTLADQEGWLLFTLCNDPDECICDYPAEGEFADLLDSLVL